MRTLRHERGSLWLPLFAPKRRALPFRRPAPPKNFSQMPNCLQVRHGDVAVRPNLRGRMEMKGGKGDEKKFCINMEFFLPMLRAMNTGILRLNWGIKENCGQKKKARGLFLQKDNGNPLFPCGADGEGGAAGLLMEVGNAQVPLLHQTAVAHHETAAAVGGV